MAGGYSYANHIRGGELYYHYLGPGPSSGTSSYEVTLKLYIDCFQNNAGQYDVSEPFTVFNKATNTIYGPVYTAPLTNEETINYDPSSNPCITNAPTDVCYRLRYYKTIITLPDAPQGYTISFQRCCRIAGIQNIVAPSDQFGATYSCDIPGTSVYPGAEKNSSPFMLSRDAVAICVGSSFSFDFSATDPDGKDSLAYSLCDAYPGGGRGNAQPNPALPPPYSSLPYNAGYSGGAPLGPKASINPVTGIITGIAPSVVGQYVVTACVSEYREGVLINVHRKDIHLKVSDCNPLKAQLDPSYVFCDDFKVTLENQQVNPTGSLYIWDFGDGTKKDTLTTPTGKIEHQYADSGTYTIKLKAILLGQCFDSTTTIAKVYPGFFPGFTVTGSCKLNPFTFTDTTKSRFGFANQWSWNFGDESTLADTASVKVPSWKYATSGIKQVTVTVTSNKGCVKTITRPVEVRDKPLINFNFRDTLICSIDSLQLFASSPGPGAYSWTPGTFIINSNTSTPIVFPKKTTFYKVTLNDNGCINSDSIRVRVVDFVTLDAGPTQTICLTDPTTLSPDGDGLAFTWSPSATLNNPNVKNPVATPTGTTWYKVIARIGKCSTVDSVLIRTIPYPIANAGADTIICFEDTAQLRATVIASSFIWSPINTLIGSNTLSPQAHPTKTTGYVLTVYDTLGCPKPGKDEVIVNVLPEILARAGNDTSIVIDQPLQLNASGAEFFTWSPPTGLDNPNSQRPTALLTSGITYVVKAFTTEGCFALDTINVKVFKTKPDIFVPSAFTPGKFSNNRFRPVPVGIATMDFFRVFNRWGQQVYSSIDARTGWDGKVNGRDQDAGVYVWEARGKDYTGKTVFKKGTMILLR